MMKYLFIISFLVTSFCSAFSQNKAGLINKVYYFGPEIDSITCRINAECDCCTDDIVFLNQKEFVKVSYCMADKSVSRGTYQASGDKLILKYKGIFISRNIDMEWESKHQSSKKIKYNWETHKVNTFSDTMIKISCKQTVIYKYEGEEILYGRLDEKTRADKFVTTLKKEGFWTKLGFK